LAVRFTDGFSSAVPLLRRALDAFLVDDGRRDDDLSWLWLAWPVAYEIWDDDTWHQLTGQLLQFARDSGALTVLPIALIYQAVVHVHEGRFAEAVALHEEVHALNQATGRPPLMYTSSVSSGDLVLTAMQGREAEAVELVRTRLRDATERREGRPVCVAEYASAVLWNGLGKYDAALAAAQRANEHEDFALQGWVLAELIEASARTGSTELGAAAMTELEQRTQPSGTEWALGIEAQCRALLTAGDDADALYREAVVRLSRTRMVVALARAQLVYGEWLRRTNRRVDAREQLRAAHHSFSHIGMESFADRAGRELLATGESARKRSVHVRAELTPQEAQIARLAGDGRTNPEVGAQLFISPRTVEWHLRKIFTKLDISSRRELPRALRSASVNVGDERSRSAFVSD
jgi:ATP/maltotriose-dependent transcriptional regulator MalT